MPEGPPDPPVPNGEFGLLGYAPAPPQNALRRAEGDEIGTFRNIDGK